MSNDRKKYNDLNVDLFFSDDAKGVNIDLYKEFGLIDVVDLIYVLRELANDFEAVSKEVFDEDEMTFKN